jgi:hypothetical protein
MISTTSARVAPLRSAASIWIVRKRKTLYGEGSNRAQFACLQIDGVAGVKLPEWKGDVDPSEFRGDFLDTLDIGVRHRAELFVEFCHAALVGDRVFAVQVACTALPLSHSNIPDRRRPVHYGRTHER